MQWLRKILVTIGDYAECRAYVEIISKYMPHWQYGRELEQRMSQHPVPKEPMEVDNQPAKDNISIDKLHWYSLAKTLIERYSTVLSQNEEIIVNQIIKIDVPESAMDYVSSQQSQTTNSESDVIFISNDAEPPPSADSTVSNEDVTMKETREEGNELSIQQQPVNSEPDVVIVDLDQSPQRDGTNTVPLKRQRSEEHSANEEDEGEDKRATLR